MFSWNISKSAEAMFSRWAMKRICKFLLKKKLGKFILGDIDLNQLDVQLGAGTIQLSDLALNVDYINEKFGTTAILVKEGSIGSLMGTMPWKDGGCRIEVNELEIVLAPRKVKVSRDEFDTCCHSTNGDNSSSHDFRKPENETPSSGVANASVDVHEGVKAIAKIVKWLLTSFNVKIKKLIVAFDPLLEEKNKKGLDKILVLRINEVECGTHISEDASSSGFTTAHNFLGLSRLTNFVKFQGAVLELLHVDGLDHQSPPEFSTETTIGSCFSGSSSSVNMVTVISGEKGGFSGNLKLSLPWRNGSLDVQKVDVDLHIEPLELRLQPSTIRCFIFMWEVFRGIGGEGVDPAHRPSDSLSASISSCMLPSDKGLFGYEDFVTECCLMEEEPVNTLLSESHLISDWVSRSQKKINEDEPDFGASAHQFFECFDELRNSQSALGNSGMWNWTCSVFSAITAASGLASGSLHVPSDQQHVETNFSAAIAKVSLLLSLIDDDQKQSQMKDDNANIDFHIHCVCAQFVESCLQFQIRPQEMNFEVIVQHIQLVDHLCSKNDLVAHKVHGCNDKFKSEIVLIRKMQDGVQGALLTYQDSNKDRATDSVDISLSVQDRNECCHMLNSKGIFGKDASVTLLKTSGVSRCHVSVNSGSSGGSSLGPISFSLKLPSLVCWVNFDLITMTIEFLGEMENCIETTEKGSDFVLESTAKAYGFSPLSDQGKISNPRSTNSSIKKIVEGSVFLANARIILCFPPKDCKDFSSYSSGNQFIAFDFMSPTSVGKDVKSANPTLVSSLDKRHPGNASCSLNLNFGDFYIFSIVGSETYNRNEASFSVEKIISVVNQTGHLSLVSMFWQEGSTTGPWIAEKAKLLASSDNGRSHDKAVGKGREFASARTVKDRKNFDTCARQEILSSSAFFLRGQLPSVTINLDKCQYLNMCGLLNQMFDHFSCIGSEAVRTREDHSPIQTSILVECDSLTVSVAIEPAGDVKCPMRSELPGSWFSITLQVDKFELLSVSNIGGIRSANFLWVAHRQGGLWGSVTEGPCEEFLLISCSDSTMGRGDGEGSNVLSSSHSGSDIIILWDPESNRNFTSISVRCTTIIAAGGRLDWFNTIFSFFSPPSSEFEQAGNNDPDKTRGSSFILNLVDVGLSYEPYYEKLTANQSSDLNTGESKDEFYVACLLAASSFKLSNTTAIDCTEGEYKIRLQDLGLLICKASDSKLVGCAYSAEHLSKIGYVKVAQEADLEVLFRTNCENSHMWELECAESNIMLNTCHDTTFGLMRLASQLQKFFAPDMQDYILHLENRWNNVQQVHEYSDERESSVEVSPSLSRTETSLDKKSEISSLMDEISEDVFQLDGSSDCQVEIFESHHCQLVNDSSLVDCGATSAEEKMPEFIEEHFLSDVRPLSELPPKSQSPDVLSCKTGGIGEARIGNGGWYADTSLRIVENHVSKVEQSNLQKPAEFEVSATNPDHVGVAKAEGRIILRNMNVIWRMYGGFDWSNFLNTSESSAVPCARDATVCLELELRGIEFDYDIYPDGEISASRLCLTIQEFYLNDRSDDAPWKLVLGYYQSKKHPRKFSSKAFKLNLETVKPDPSIRIEENRLCIALLPVCLHLHQTQLDFLISFFGGKNSSADSSQNAPLGLNKSGDPFEKIDNLQGRAISEEAFLTYFQKFDIWPMLIRVDYSPCRVDLSALSGGKYVELVNIVPWKGVELQLKHVQGVGLYGWSRVCETILGEWLEDISQNQIHKLLKGLPPIKSLVAVGSGAAKLVSLPVKSYKKDHRLLKGMQRGTFAFLRSISLEAIDLGVHLSAGAHNILLQAEHILASIPSSVPWPIESRASTNVKSNQPVDAQQGFQQAYQSISDGLGKSASALVQTPLKRYQRGASVGSALASAVQSVPAAAMAPASATARAVHCAFLGFRNSLDPERKRESLEKYSGRTPPQETMQ
ncbi:Cytoplasm to vacuole targeting protein [Handroanthus impetiginosus]|uniref:Autophagy-related protein 2 n=1 Tax=Handroanthus impetiginosus TaxID=429701 RepID=A0A2G9G211_9LAMI|nr:Cytoplasm to vacuole targeting protein [Handroanthus impetiginosus]